MSPGRLLVAFVTVAGLWGGAGWRVLGEEQSPPVKVLSPLDPLPYESSQAGSSPKAELELRIRERVKDDPSVATLEFQIWSTYYDTEVFNPYSLRLIPASYNIAVFDEQHVHVGSLHSVSSSGSRREASSGDWERIKEDEGLCYRIRMRSARVYRPWKGDKLVLPPGKYELQVVANSRFFYHSPFNQNGEIDSVAGPVWDKHRVNADEWRSNRVTLEIRESDSHDLPPPPQRSRPPAEE